jgi:hypothetical protein
VDVLSYSCCLCGKPVMASEAVRLIAEWGDSAPPQWQQWGAHRDCLTAAFTDEARDAGGPLFGDVE